VEVEALHNGPRVVLARGDIHHIGPTLAPHQRSHRLHVWLARVKLNLILLHVKWSKNTKKYTSKLKGQVKSGKLAFLGDFWLKNGGFGDFLKLTLKKNSKEV
jgi:hypothetical protein